MSINVMAGMNRRTVLEDELDSFDADERGQALERLAGEYGRLLGPEKTNVNMHLHSFFSYNAEDYSPSHLAWEARKAGLYAAGLCDFDVLDGLEEFLDAGLTLGLRTTVNIETRAYLPEFADVDISSPGEPGVTYIMGAGFARTPAPGSPQEVALLGYRQRAHERNVALVSRINAHLPQMAVDYEQDVLPLTPSGAATERHIVKAYLHKVVSVLEHPAEVAAFWSRMLGKDAEQSLLLLTDLPNLEETVRAKLVKRGGVGYVQPSVGTFPPVDEFVNWVRACEAVPMTTWLDGTSGGERDPRALLECMRAKGAAALNIIPDRNWNVADPKQREIKQRNLKAIVETAEDLGLPINIGTEMNRAGQLLSDDLDGEALRPYKDIFTRGARIMVGHTRLLRFAGLSYVGGRASSEFGEIRARNAFFERVGALPALTANEADALEDMGAEKALEWLRERAKHGQQKS